MAFERIQGQRLPTQETGSPSMLRKMEAIARTYEARGVGRFRIIQVGNAGFIAEPAARIATRARVALVDFDDVTGATTEIKDAPGGRVDGKPTLFARYKDYAGASIPDATLRQVIELTNQFSRWKDVDGGDDIYHQGAHASALQWATEQLRGKTRAEIQPTVAAIGETLARIKKGLMIDHPVREGDPFRFRRSDRHLVTRSYVPWSKEMEMIFMEAMIKPPYYREMVGAIGEIGRRPGVEGMDAYAFTAGDPLRQLPKFFEYLLANPDASMHGAWITQVAKGDFVRELQRLGLLEDKDYVHVDDSIKQIRSVMEASPNIVGVLSRRPGTREGKKELPTESLPFPVIDFGTNAVSKHDVVQVLHTALSAVGARRGGGRFTLADAA